MPNPNIPQGILNRLRTSIVFPDNPSLNVTAPYLGKQSVRFSFDGKAAMNLPTLTGTVISPEPYILVVVRINLVKSQPLADAWKVQMETNSIMGNATVRTDAPTLSVYQFVNTSITGVDGINASGDDADYMATLEGYYSVNQSLFG